MFLHFKAPKSEGDIDRERTSVLRGFEGGLILTFLSPPSPSVAKSLFTWSSQQLKTSPVSLD